MQRDEPWVRLPPTYQRVKAWLEEGASAEEIALLALQGPQAARILQPLTSVDLSTIKYYHFAVGTVAGIPDIIVSRTGYTGEDGFELYFDNANATHIWNARRSPSMRAISAVQSQRACPYWRFVIPARRSASLGIGSPCSIRRSAIRFAVASASPMWSNELGPVRVLTAVRRTVEL